jgi:hypothetical protein
MLLIADADLDASSVARPLRLRRPPLGRLPATAAAAIRFDMKCSNAVRCTASKAL